MKRPDFREIKKLIKSLHAMNADLQNMFGDAARQEEKIHSCLSSLKKKQAVEELALIPVEELKNARAGIRTAALEEAGYETLQDLYRAQDWALLQIEGIGDRQVASIRTILDEFLGKIEGNCRVSLLLDSPDPDYSACARDLIGKLALYRQASLVRKDAELIRRDFSARIPELDHAVKIRTGLHWFFSGRAKKDETAIAVGALVEFVRSPVFARAARFLDLYRQALGTSQDQAVRDFQKNSAPYYALLEKFGGIKEAGKAAYSSIPAQLAEQIDSMELDLSLFRGDLRAYQSFGSKYILTQKNVLLGDEMGLGKTIQAIAAMCHLQALQAEPADIERGDANHSEKNAEKQKEDWPGPIHFLIVCPASVMINWCREIARFSDIRTSLLHGTFLDEGFARWKETGGAAVTNYESMGKIAGRIDGKMHLAMLVIDEAHYIKNPEARRTRLINSLREESERILLMTGTPLENRVDEMCRLIGFVRPDLAREAEANAGLRYVSAFKEMLAPVYLRRQRGDVLEELPPCTEEEEWCSMTPQDMEAYSASVLNKNFNEMRRVSFLQDDLFTSSKSLRLAELCAQAADEGRKIIIYSYFRETIRKVADFLRGRPFKGGKGEERPVSGNDVPPSSSISAGIGESEIVLTGIITGDTPAGDRQSLVDRFSDGPAGSILLCQIQAGGTGLNIQAAGVVIFCEPQIKPSLTRQAIGRAWRMGQSANVLVCHLLCEDTVDDRIRRILAEKQAEFALFADESALADAADSLLDREWIQKIVEEERRKYMPSVIKGNLP